MGLGGPGGIPEEELQEVSVTVAKEPTITFSVRLSRDDVNRIRAAAQVRGVGPTELARAWVLEHTDARSLGASGDLGWFRA